MLFSGTDPEPYITNYTSVYEEKSCSGCESPRLRAGGNNLNGFQDFRTANGSSQGQNLALTGLFVPTSFESGTEGTFGRLPRNTSC